MQTAGVMPTLTEYQETLPAIVVDVMGVISEGRSNFQDNERTKAEAARKAQPGRQ